jgi:hypothetical protein
MPILRSAVSVLSLSLWILIAGCSDSPTDTTTPGRPEFATDAYCALHPDICTPSTPDPAPASPGYFPGAQLTDRYCAGLAGGINDVDADHLSDECEVWLATKFAPIMTYDAHDDVGRESFWAARPIAVGLVRVFYALAYYFDLGTIPEELTACRLSSLGDVVADCDGHHGDSENIVLDLRYNTSTQHWLVAEAKLSHHTDIIVVKGGPSGYPTLLSYPNKVAGYPQIFVARQKHANYPSRQSCNAGGGAPWPLVIVVPFDDCSPNSQLFRPEINPLRNLGSNAKRRVDCVASFNFFYQIPVRKECMWSATRFYGWQIDRTTSATGYGTLLRAQGF